MVEVPPRPHDKFNYRPAVLVLLANGAVHVTMLAWLRDQCPRDADLIKVEEIAVDDQHLNDWGGREIEPAAHSVAHGFQLI